MVKPMTRHDLQVYVAVSAAAMGAIMEAMRAGIPLTDVSVERVLHLTYQDALDMSPETGPAEDIIYQWVVDRLLSHGILLQDTQGHQA